MHLDLNNFKDRILSLIVSPYQRLYFLIILLIAAISIRIYFSQTLALWNDEAITANAAIALKNTGIPAFPSGFEYWRSIPYTYAVAASSYLLGNSEIALRAPSILFSSFSIILTYLHSKKLYGPQVGLIASTILSFSLWHIAWSSQVRSYILFQVIYIGVILLIYRFDNQRKIIDILLLSMLMILGVYVHKIGYILPFVFYGYLSFRQLLKKDFRKIKITQTIALILTTLILIFAQAEVSDLMAQLSLQWINIELYRQIIIANLPLVLIFSCIGILVGLKEHFSETVLLLISVFPAATIIVLLVDGAASRYLFFSLPILVIWTALAVQKISLYTNNLISSEENLAKIMMTILTIFILVFGAMNSSIYDFRPDAPDKSVYTHLGENAEQNDALMTQWTPVMTYYYRPPDYSLYGDEDSMFSFIRKDHTYNGRELYAGAKFINDSTGLERVINNNSRGWLVLRDKSYDRKRTDVKEIISQLFSVGDYEGYKMWKWNSSIKNLE